MKIAFDYGNVLETQQGLRCLMRAMRDAGIDVCVISAMGRNDETRIRESLKSMGYGDVPLYCVFMDDMAWPPDVSGEVGRAKADVMAQNGVTILIDDNPYICENVREAGLLAIQVVP